jgi:hypothetical protein
MPLRGLTWRRSRADGEPQSALDRLIPPEIKDDPFSEAIVAVAEMGGVQEILEIGSSSGDGSTEAWVRGARARQPHPRLHCIEVSVARHEALVERWRDEPIVHCYNVSSIPIDRFASEEDVARFYDDVHSPLNAFSLETVLGWLRQDVEYVSTHGLSSHGIRMIRESLGIDAFDAVLIDGSEFTGTAELDEVYGARFVLLDDTRTFKNWQNARRLAADPSYRLVRCGQEVRNGFAVFERVASD